MLLLDFTCWYRYTGWGRCRHSQGVLIMYVRPTTTPRNGKPLKRAAQREGAARKTDERGGREREIQGDCEHDGLFKHLWLRLSGSLLCPLVLTFIWPTHHTRYHTENIPATASKHVLEINSFLSSSDAKSRETLPVHATIKRNTLCIAPAIEASPAGCKDGFQEKIRFSKT